MRILRNILIVSIIAYVLFLMLAQNKMKPITRKHSPILVNH